MAIRSNLTMVLALIKTNITHPISTVDLKITLTRCHKWLLRGLLNHLRRPLPRPHPQKRLKIPSEQWVESSRQEMPGSKHFLEAVRYLNYLNQSLRTDIAASYQIIDILAMVQCNVHLRSVDNHLCRFKFMLCGWQDGRDLQPARSIKGTMSLGNVSLPGWLLNIW